MSRENVEFARRAYGAFNTRDISGWLAMHSADVELHDLPTFLAQRSIAFTPRCEGGLTS
jgi:hypothetical protein